MIQVLKLIPLITCCFFLCSCHHKASSGQDKDPRVSNDTLVKTMPAGVDTGRLNIDGWKVSPHNFKLLLENDHVRVLEYTLKPGEKDTPHTHPPKASYVVSGGKIRVYFDHDKSLDFDEKAGTAVWGEYVGKHYVENIGNTTITIILTEIKSLQ